MSEKKLRVFRASDIEVKPSPDSSQALPASELSWSRIKRIEPRLAGVESIIECIHDPGWEEGFCANDIWYGYTDARFSFKEQVNTYTGWFAEHPLLRSETAYDIAYEHLYDLLPDCRDCLCG